MSLRRLKRAWYEIFESDVAALDLSSSLHVLDREIRLEFETGESLFITWGREPTMYCVTISETSSFETPPPTALDVSDSPAWRDLVGATLDLEFLDARHQVLRIRGDGACCYVASQENDAWETDVISVSRERPGRR